MITMSDDLDLVNIILSLSLQVVEFVLVITVYTETATFGTILEGVSMEGK